MDVLLQQVANFVFRVTDTGIDCFLKCLRYRQTQTSSGYVGNAANTQPGFGSRPLCDRPIF